jgi:hypothetical protein
MTHVETVSPPSTNNVLSIYDLAGRHQWKGGFILFLNAETQRTQRKPFSGKNH